MWTHSYSYFAFCASEGVCIANSSDGFIYWSWEVTFWFFYNQRCIRCQEGWFFLFLGVFVNRLHVWMMANFEPGILETGKEWARSSGRWWNMNQKFREFSLGKLDVFAPLQLTYSHLVFSYLCSKCRFKTDLKCRQQLSFSRFFLFLVSLSSYRNFLMELKFL